MTRLGQHSVKGEGIDVFVALHLLHFSRHIIGQLTGFSSQYVGDVLHQCGYDERWDNVADVRANLHPTLLESCAKLLGTRSFSNDSP
jgi:hypothetical protein